MAFSFGRRKSAASGSARSSSKRTQQAAVLAGIGALLVGALGVGAWQMLGPSADDGEGALEALASNAIDTASEMTTALRENVTRDASLLAKFLRGSESEEEEVGEPEDADATVESNAAAAAPSRRRAPKAPPTLEPVPMVRTGPSVIAELPELPPLPGIFDVDTPGIIPPGTENIRLHTLDGEVGPSPETSLVEVIVSPYGEVERAKLVSAPADIHEAMILSAIKAWQFTPAVKDGHPVRYRLVLPVDLALSGQVLATQEADVPSQPARN